ncbi:hypothetical protein VTH8203_04482 [Vibrio thalassae]|uniref:Cytochrome b561 bacterial/Ni-hydrogenase domain-containing protein n=1 Tax=Vibrio thalassae TaxID=1243014 RepID=A0A240EQB1_9VIBR|nr:cytochrome b/b6 domain-containing protein [Vibrio thalassae]SNX50808.1 hypothetical protein VTH8203_04482 [Vibrio thalassae]
MMLSRIKEGVDTLFTNLPESEKVLHALTLFWVLVQIISSNFIHVHADTLWSSINSIAKIHIYSGLLLIPLTLVFVYKVIKRRTIGDMYPWLSGNFTQIKQDLQCLSRVELPESHPAGIAATVEGLGLLALLLALVTGTAWYLSASSTGISPELLKIHKTSVGLIETYFYGHGAMALLHFIHWWREG